LLAFARRQPLDPKPLNANLVIQGMSELLRRRLARRAWNRRGTGSLGHRSRSQWIGERAVEFGRQRARRHADRREVDNPARWTWCSPTSCCRAPRDWDR